jgi:hypothetical protein
MPNDFVNQLHYGDNLIRLRGEGVDKAIPDEVADSIYLDPPFNSSRQYSLLFKQHKGQDSPAQIMAFEDTWTYSGLIHAEFRNDKRNAKLFELVDSLYRILLDSEMMAYVLMMAPRLLELHGKLKKTGSLFLHCARN